MSDTRPTSRTMEGLESSPAPERMQQPLNQQEKESLIMLIVLHFAEDRGLLNTEQLEDARASLRALFLRATGEETMLRKLIGILKVNRALNRTFSDMMRLLDGVKTAHRALVERHESLKQHLATLNISPDENTRFTGPLLDYSGTFVRAVGAFAELMSEYREAREHEARCAQVYRLAQEAREHLKQRFEKGAAQDKLAEQQVKKRVIQNFNFAEAESEYRYAQRSAASTRAEVETAMHDFHQMCQMAMKPEMRSSIELKPSPGKDPCPDIFAICQKAMQAFPRLQTLQPKVEELLRLYQKSFALFMMDFEKFNKALVPMIENTEDYFAAKEKDEDVRTKLHKLQLIEALISYIEDVAQLLSDKQTYNYSKFSSAVTAHILRPDAGWAKIAEPLLLMKVTAEAELSTRLT
jgi:hypothetical protein